MSREKQIEEMAKTIEQSGMLDSYSRCEIVAEELYNADYRKQSEGEWLVKNYTMTNGWSLGSTVTCSLCGYRLERGPAWKASMGVYKFCPNCGAKMK